MQEVYYRKRSSLAANARYKTHLLFSNLTFRNQQQISISVSLEIKQLTEAIRLQQISQQHSQQQMENNMKSKSPIIFNRLELRSRQLQATMSYSKSHQQYSHLLTSLCLMSHS